MTESSQPVHIDHWQPVTDDSCDSRRLTVVVCAGLLAFSCLLSLPHKQSPPPKQTGDGLREADGHQVHGRSKHSR